MVQGLCVHIVDFDEVSIFTKLKEVCVIVPEVWIILPFAPEAGHFIEDAEVFNVFFRLELLTDRFNQLSLIVGHLVLNLTGACIGSSLTHKRARVRIPHELILVSNQLRAPHLTWHIVDLVLIEVLN